jgi:uncharacterized protein (DUF983 family)
VTTNSPTSGAPRVDGSRPGLWTLLRRGARKRCPACGQGRAFKSWFKMHESCPECEYRFEREEGYWVGALIINMAFAEFWFVILFAAVVITTLPEIPWTPLLAVAVVTNGLFPAIFYPYSKTLWMSVDIYLHPVAKQPPDV